MFRFFVFFTMLFFCKPQFQELQSNTNSIRFKNPLYTTISNASGALCWYEKSAATQWVPAPITNYFVSYEQYKNAFQKIAQFITEPQFTQLKQNPIFSAITAESQGPFTAAMATLQFVDPNSNNALFKTDLTSNNSLIVSGPQQPDAYCRTFANLHADTQSQLYTACKTLTDNFITKIYSPKLQNLYEALEKSGNEDVVLSLNAESYPSDESLQSFTKSLITAVGKIKESSTPEPCPSKMYMYKTKKGSR